MRRLMIFVLLVFFGVSGNAQEKTYVYGKLENCEDVEVHIKLLEFDEENLTDKGYGRNEYGRTIKGEVFGDTTFLLEIDSLMYSSTQCIFFLGYQTKTILLSPGDSLEMNIDYWGFDSRIDFDGEGSGANNYWQEAFVRYGGRIRALATEQGFSQERIKILQNIRSGKQSLLGSYLENGEIDSTFFEWETRRIQYEYLSMLLSSSLGHRPKDSNSIDFILEEVADFNFADSVGLFLSGSYRALVRTVPAFLVDPYTMNPNRVLKHRLNLGEIHYSGIIGSFYMWTEIKKELDYYDSHDLKQMVFLYVERNVDDPRIERLLEKNKYLYFVWPKQRNGLFFQGAFYFTMVILLLVLGLTFWWLTSIAKAEAKKEPKVKPLQLLAASISFLIMLIPVRLVFFQPFAKVLPNLIGILFCIAIILSGRFITPWFFDRKFIRFFIGNVLVSVALLLGINHLYDVFGHLSDYPERGNTINAWCIYIVAIPLVMLLVNYLVNLHEKGKDLKDLKIDIRRNGEWLIHMTIVFLLYMNSARLISTESGIRNMVLTFVAIGAFYSSALWLGPRFLLRKKFGWFALWTVLVLVVLNLIIIFNEALNSFYILQGRGIRIPFDHLLDWQDSEYYILLLILPGLLYAAIRRRYHNSVQIGLTLYKRKEAELQQLRSQVNPHFLFNSLNTVYAQALKEENPKTAKSIAKLSNMMRYLIEDMDQDQIPIRKEIGYIHDYITLQKARSAVEQDIRVDIILTDEQLDQGIAPMLMIPFVENAFKHGINPNKKSDLEIRIEMEDNSFKFFCRNSVDPEFETFSKEKGFGIGIPNVRQRLEYQYPDKHKLSIEDTEAYFLVRLFLDLEQTNKLNHDHLPHNR